MDKLNAHMPVDQVMRQWPGTIRIFIDFGMKCVGCPFGTFHTIATACDEHHMAPDDFLAALEAAVVVPVDGLGA